MTAPSSSTASANGPKSIRLMNTFQIPSPSPVTTAASTPRRIDTPRYSTLSTSNPVNKVNKVSYSFDDRDRIIPSVKMRTISHDEQVLKNTRKKRASSVDSSHGSSRTGKGTRVSWHVVVICWLCVPCLFNTCCCCRCCCCRFIRGVVAFFFFPRAQANPGKTRADGPVKNTNSFWKDYEIMAKNGKKLRN